MTGRELPANRCDHLFISVSQAPHRALFVECEQNAQDKRDDGAEKFAGESVYESVDTADRIDRVRLIVMDAVKRHSMAIKVSVKPAPVSNPGKAPKIAEWKFLPTTIS